MLANGDTGCGGDVGEGAFDALLHPKVPRAIAHAIVVKDVLDVHRQDLGANGDNKLRCITAVPFYRLIPVERARNAEIRSSPLV
jgi:hypothetical protein